MSNNIKADQSSSLIRPCNETGKLERNKGGNAFNTEIKDCKNMDDTTRRYLMEQFAHMPESFQEIDKFNPDLMDALAKVRMSIISEKKSDMLSPKTKELIVTALEVITGRGEKGRSHARKAIRAGATPKEVFESVSLCIYLGGMMTWVDSGADAVRSAEDEYNKMKSGQEFKWSAEVPK